jgi:hypothetical protein
MSGIVKVKSGLRPAPRQGHRPWTLSFEKMVSKGIGFGGFLGSAPVLLMLGSTP